jgi:hypothetical protein
MASEHTLSEKDVKALSDAIKAHGSAPKSADFCTIWPGAKQGLQLLLQIIDKVPGIGLFAKAAIGIVIAAGDAASAAFCK